MHKSATETINKNQQGDFRVRCIIISSEKSVDNRSAYTIRPFARQCTPVDDIPVVMVAKSTRPGLSRDWLAEGVSAILCTRLLPPGQRPLRHRPRCVLVPVLQERGSTVNVQFYVNDGPRRDPGVRCFFDEGPRGPWRVRSGARLEEEWRLLPRQLLRQGSSLCSLTVYSLTT